MNKEAEFLHDLVNKISLAYGKINRVLMKSETLSKVEIIENIGEAKNDLDAAFEVINERKLTINGGPILK